MKYLGCWRSSTTVLEWWLHNSTESLKIIVHEQQVNITVCQLELNDAFKAIYTIWFHLYKVLENANQSVDSESRAIVSWGRWEQSGRWETAKGQENTLGVGDIFKVSWCGFTASAKADTHHILLWTCMHFPGCRLYLKILLVCFQPFCCDNQRDLNEYFHLLIGVFEFTPRAQKR